MIDKNLEARARIADRHTIIEKGRVAWSGSSAVTPFATRTDVGKRRRRCQGAGAGRNAFVVDKGARFSLQGGD